MGRVATLRAVEREEADRLGRGVPEGVPEAGRDEREVTGDEAVDATAEVEQELAAQDVERLLERVGVRREPAAGEESDHRELGVDGALIRADDPQPAEPGRRRRGGRRGVHERPVDVTDGVHLDLLRR